MARPTVDLDWAENDVVDPTSGQNNKVEPPTAWKNNGWGYQEKPPRNYDNYHKWNAGQWIKYLDTAIGRACTLKVAADDAMAETKAHADYVCDGTADQTEINAAIAAASATGGLVLLSEGTFTVDGEITLDDNVHVAGMGRGATTIQVAATASSDFSVMKASGNSDITLKDFTIHGNSGAIAQNHIGVEISTSSRMVLRDLEITLIDRDTSDGLGVGLTDSINVLIDSCYISSCYYGVSIVQSAGTSRDIIVSNCEVNNCSSTNIYIDASSPRCSILNCRVHSGTANGISCVSDYCRIIGNDVRDNDTNGIICGNYNVVADNIVSGNGYHGISLVSTDYAIIKGNQIFGNSQDTHDTYNGINIDSNSDSCVVTANLVHKGSGFQHQYGINCASSTNYVFGNYLLQGGNTANLNGTVKISWGAGLVGAPQIYDAGAAGHVNITGQLTNVTA